MKKEKIGLALGGGSSRGYAHISILSKMSKDGFSPDLVSGTSVGALVGAYYCLNGEVDTLLENISKMKKKDWLSLIDLQNPKKSIMKGVKIKKFLKKEFFGDKTFSDLKIPMVIVATNLSDDKIEYINKGKLIDAVLASISIPGVLKPFEKDGNVFIDGGILENLPIHALSKKRIKKIVAIDLFSSRLKLKTNYNSAFDVLMESFYLMMSRSAVNFDGLNIFVFEPKFTKKVGDIMKFYVFKDKINSGVIEYNQKRKSLKKWWNL